MDYRSLAYKTAQKYGIDPDLFVRQIQAESAFNPAAVSSAGAIGLGQLMPATAKELGVDPTDPVQNLEGAARYMKQLLGRYDGNQTLALAAYNAGMGNVDKAGGVPNFKETQNYIAKIMGSNMAQQPTQPQQPQQQSQGLLGGILGGQGIGGALGLSDDFRDRLKMGLLLGSDPRAFAPMVAGIQARGKERRAEARAQKDTNKTLEYLKQKAEAGDSLAAQYYEAVSTGTIKAGAAVANYLKDSQATPKTYQYQALAKDLLDKGLAKTEAEALQMALSQTRAGTTVNVGPQGEALPPPPSGYVYRYNDDRTVKLDDQGVPMVVPLSGGPKDETKVEEAKSQSKATMTGTILQEAQKARELIGPYSTGFGSLLSSLPTTDARQLELHVRSLKAQATIETLNAMRQQSPTGGALGNVTNAENAMLAAKAGALDPASGADAFAQQLDDYEETLLKIVHGNDAGAKIFKESRSVQPSSSSQPRTDDDLLKKYGG